ncbi:GNAT family N-acetyltransferase [Aeromicrobium sp. Leaf350]|uniref:GNAT family N-acetyltransferase n=1 Tax=Aeromicrobium sp. Leaf350 TaxID=2876565 RepID=UPI001E4324F9|nr:GNAT family N-acetyltransferase [Aeromicrobium sp. Leaf350]
MSELAWPLSVPVLSDGTVTLRAHTPADLDAMLETATDPEMVRWTSVPNPYDRSHAKRFLSDVVAAGWDSGAHLMWAIEVLDENGHSRFAGDVAVRGRGVSDIGFSLHPEARGQGVMTAAVRLAVQHCFDSGFSEAVQWKAHVGNLASLRVAHACGFRLIAEVPSLLFERGRAIDGWLGVLTFGDLMFARQPWRGREVLDVRTRSGRDLVLREATLDDVPRLAEALSDAETQRWLVDMPRDEAGTRTAVARWWWRAATGQVATWVVADAGTDDALGEICVMDLHGLDPTSGEIGYALHPDARGHGVLRAALPAVLDHSFSPAGLRRRRITAAAAEGNEASLAILRGAGFVPTGRQTAAEPLGDGTYADLHELELLR